MWGKCGCMEVLGVLVLRDVLVLATNAAQNVSYHV